MNVGNKRKKDAITKSKTCQPSLLKEVPTSQPQKKYKKAKFPEIMQAGSIQSNVTRIEMTLLRTVLGIILIFSVLFMFTSYFTPQSS